MKMMQIVYSIDSMNTIDQIRQLNQQEDQNIVSYNELLQWLQKGLLDEPHELAVLPWEIEQAGDVAHSFFEALSQLLDSYSNPATCDSLDETSRAFAEQFLSIVSRWDGGLPLLDHELHLYEQFSAFRQHLNSFELQNSNKHYRDELLVATTVPPEKNLEIMGISLDTVPNWSVILKQFPTKESRTTLRVDDIARLLPRATVKQDYLPYVVRNLQVFFVHYLYVFPDYKNYKWEGMTHHTLQDCVLHMERMKKIGQYFQDLKNKYISISQGRSRFPIDSIARDSLELYLGTMRLNDQQFAAAVEKRAPHSSLLTIAKKYESTSFCWPLLQTYILTRLGPYKKAIKGSEAFWFDETQLTQTSDGKTLLSLMRETRIGQQFLSQNGDIQQRMEALQQLQLHNVDLRSISSFFDTISQRDKKIAEFKAKGDAAYPDRVKQAEMSFGPAGEPGERAFRAGMYEQARQSAYADYYHQNERLLYFMNVDYVKLLLSASPPPSCVSQRQVIINPLTGTKLDFSKGSNPDDIVRDGFGEQFSDGVEKTIDAWKQGRRSEVGQQIGSLVGWSLVFAATLVVTKNPWVASASFTIWSRLWATAGWFLGAVAEGKSPDDVWNIAMNATGFFDQQGNAYGADKIVLDLAGDIIVHRATLGLSKVMPPVLSGSNNVFSQWLRFGMQELVWESLLIDPAFNVMRTGINTFVGTDAQPVVWSTALNAPSSSEPPLDGGADNKLRYQARRISDAFQAAREATQLNFSPENLGQVVSSTILYGGIMEGVTKTPQLLKSIAGRASDGLDHISQFLSDKITSLQAFLQEQHLKLTTFADGNIALVQNNSLLLAWSELYTRITDKIAEILPILNQHREAIANREHDIRKSLLDNPILQRVLAIAASFKLFESELPPVEHIKKLLEKLYADLEQAKMDNNLGRVRLIQSHINDLLLVWQYVGYHYAQKNNNPASLRLPAHAYRRHSASDYYTAWHTTVQKLTNTLSSVKNIVFCGSSALFMWTEHNTIPEDVEPSIPASDFPNALHDLAHDTDFQTLDITDVNGNVLRTIMPPPQAGELELIVWELSREPGYQHLKITGHYQVWPVPYAFEIFFVDQGTALAGEAMGAATYDIDMWWDRPVRFLEKWAQADYYGINLIAELYHTTTVSAYDRWVMKPGKYHKAWGRMLKIGMLRPDLTVDGFVWYLDAIVAGKQNHDQDQRNSYINDALNAYPQVREDVRHHVEGFKLKRQQIDADAYAKLAELYSDDLINLGTKTPAQILDIQAFEMANLQRLLSDIHNYPDQIDKYESQYLYMLDRIALYQHIATSGDSLSHLAIFISANNMLEHMMPPVAQAISQARTGTWWVRDSDQGWWESSHDPSRVNDTLATWNTND